MEESLRESEARYREIFENAPIALWVEDWSRVRVFIDRLIDEGVEDFHAYFAENRGRVVAAYDLVEVLQTSKASLDLYGAMEAADYVGASRGALVLPEELDGDISRRHNRVSDEVTEARRPVLDLWVPDQPKMPQSGSSSPEVSTISPSVASEKPKRKALTLRLEPDSYNRLHQACAATGRSRQDILFTGMSKYLDLLDARETVESGD